MECCCHTPPPPALLLNGCVSSGITDFIVLKEQCVCVCFKLGNPAPEMHEIIRFRISMTMVWTEHRLWGVEALKHRLKIWVSGRPSQVRQTNTLEEVAISSKKSHGEVRLTVCNMPANSKGRREHAADHRQVYVSVPRRGKPAEICGC
jgi:hypothetical protein